MKRLCFALLFMMAPFVAQAAEFSNPRALLEAFYARYFQPEWESDEGYLSVGILTLMEQDLQEANGEVGRLGFDPFIQGQDWDTQSVDIGRVDVLGGTAQAEVSFVNFGRPIELTISLVLEREGWKIDDAWWPADDEVPAGSLREILTEPWP